MADRSGKLNTERVSVPGTGDWHSSFRELLLIAGFCFCLVPFSIDGNSANYAFMLIPLGALLTGRVHVPSRNLLPFIYFYLVIFVVAVIYQYELIDELPRRTTSFLLFMSAFSFMFIEIDSVMVRAFKRALVVAGIAFSLLSIIAFFALGGSELGYEAKDAVGGQRYGFIYILAFWLVVLSRPKRVPGRLLKHAATFTVLSGLVLSFSRSSVVALIASGAAYAVWAIRHEVRGSLRQAFKRIVFTVLGAAIAILLLGTFFPVILDFFEVRLFGFLADSETLQGNLADMETSEGTRIFIWKNILDYVIYNPLTGSGFLGVWILRLFDEMSGSAHNQYFDVLFRVGFLGLLIYAFLLYKTGRFLALNHPGLFWGFVGVIVYGMFHETFKESHGGFVLAFLFGMMSQESKRMVSYLGSVTNLASN